MFRDALIEAGWPIYLVLLFGITSLVLAIRHAAVPATRRMPLIVGLGVTTLLWGALGTVLGLIHAIKGVSALPPDQHFRMWVGLGEAINNMAFALFFQCLAALFATIGAVRMARRLDEVDAKTAH